MQHKPASCRRRALGVTGGLLLVCLGLTALSFMLNQRLPTATPEPEALSPADAARLAEAYQLRQALGDDVWPGWGTAEIPAIVYNEANAFLVAYGAEPPAGWQTVPRGEALGGAWTRLPEAAAGGTAVYRAPLPGQDVTPQAFTVRVGDRYVASLGTKLYMEMTLAAQMAEQLPPGVDAVAPYGLITDLFIGDSAAYVAALLHESFHAYQAMLAPDKLAAAETAVSRQEAAYPFADDAAVAAWQAELDLLAAAVQADSEAEAADLARQFLQRRAARRQATGLAPAQVAYEQQREWLEGLAKFVELRIWRAAATTTGYEPAAALAADADFDGYGGYARKWRNEVSQIRRMAGDEGDGRFYYSGMAQAVLLDRLLPGWQAQALAPDVYLEELLQAAVGSG